MSDLRLYPVPDRFSTNRASPAWYQVIDHAPDDLATVGYTVVASALGAVLRKALGDHCDRHGCGTPRLPLFECDEGRRLFELQPEGDRIVLATPPDAAVRLANRLTDAVDEAERVATPDARG